MKGNYRRKSPHTNRIRTIVVYTLVLLVALLLVRPVASRVASVAYSGVSKVSYWLFESTASFPGYFRDKNDLLNEITELESELAGHSGDRLTIEGLVSENIELRSLLKASSSKRFFANIVARPPQVAFDSLLLDIGLNQGAVEGSLVYAYDDKVIGVVARAFDNSAVVKLITSPETVSTVYIQGPNIYTTATGMGGGVLQVNVPQGVILEKGNLVLVPALGAGIYGAIEEVVSIPTEPVQYGFVTAGKSLQNLRSVAVGSAPVEQISFSEAESIIKEFDLQQLVIDVPESESLDEVSNLDGSTTTDSGEDVVNESTDD